MINVYYRESVQGESKLRCIAADVKCHKEAIMAVMEQLHINMEIFYPPVLALIKGGK